MKMLTFESRKATEIARGVCLRATGILLLFCGHLYAQDDLQEKIQTLTDAMTRTQAQVEESQRELNEMRAQLAALKQQLAHQGPDATQKQSTQDASNAASNAAHLNSAIDELREQQAMQASQIATHEQAKVESDSKYPVKITGLILLNGFVNTHAVDIPATPTVSIPGNGNTGASIRQTVLGIEAHGPHLFGARSYADLSVDFNGMRQSSSATTYYNSNTTLLRLRTAHAGLAWDQTQAYFALDRPIFSPDTPTSLTAVAVPALAWSGNLWTWNPEVALRHDFRLDGGRNAQLEAAVVDVADAPLTPQSTGAGAATGALVSSGEASRTPGVEAHAAFFPSRLGLSGSRFGAGGYFLRHQTTLGHRFDSWAATLDMKLYLPARLELTGSAYRGLGLGGLGAGGYKDFASIADSDGDGYYVRPLDDVGGWMQLKEKWSQRLETNAAFGTDNLFASQMRPYYVPSAGIIANLVRNQTYTGNIIYSPSSYIMFSLEYRRIESRPVEGLSSGSNVIMLGAGYKF
ncbi:hypothetical protein [Silvibacterium acidisoli]|uniref:hypothetical protein n=1 Tax=Acidobacteriaceae bacterium ZG23-2 TaxID=2883246 RepID=UPI00406C1846